MKAVETPEPSGRGSATALRVFVRHLGIAIAGVALLASIQFLVVDHMPGWQSGFGEMSNRRLTNFRLLSDGRRAIAEYFGVDHNLPKKQINLSFQILNLDQQTQLSDVNIPGLLCAKCSPDSQLIALGFADGRLSLRTIERVAESQSEIHTVNYHKPISDIHWSPDGNRLLLGFNGASHLIEKTGEVICKIPSRNEAATICPPKSNCFCLAMDRRFRLYDWRDGAELMALPIDASIRSVTFSHDLRFVAGLAGCDLVVFEISTGKQVWSQKTKSIWSARNAIAFSFDDRSIAIIQQCNQNRHQVCVYDFSTQCQIGRHEVDDGYLNGIELSDDSLWAWSTDGQIRKFGLDESKSILNLSVLQCPM